MSFARLIVFTGLLFSPALVSAQSSEPLAHTSVTAPTIQNERVGVAPVAVTAESSEMALAQPRFGQSVALMVVGGAALVAGLIIGGEAGTVVALGGAVVGLVGLYQYLR